MYSLMCSERLKGVLFTCICKVLTPLYHITTGPACCTLTNVLQHLNAMLQTGHDTPPHHSVQTQDMTYHPITVYRHRTLHLPHHSVQTQDMTPHPITVYRHRT